MNYYRKLTTLSIGLAVAALVTVLAGGANADWFPGDGHKMHFPQLPDPFGWDVFAGTNTDGTQKILADDWRCSETGFVEDVHLWGSWRQDEPGFITNVHLSIHEDVPLGADPLVPYSHPGALLWEDDFGPTEFTILDPWGTGAQGWFNPNTLEVNPIDHFTFHQINIVDIPDPFIQDFGTIYWLDVTVTTAPFGGFPAEWGWKTSQDHFNDDAVFGDSNATGGVDAWSELIDPMTGESLDMAFVITGRPIPEPATCMLIILGLGAIVTTRRRAC